MQNDDFFIISSDELEKIETKLYGYVTCEDSTYTQENNGITNGSYIQISSSEDSITLTQDYYGSYGLYIYNDNDDYALSNSFAQLVKFLKEKHTLTLNEEYAETFLTTKENLSFDESIINEITQIPGDTQIIINKKDKKITYKKIEIPEKTTDADTQELIQTIDNWFNQWIQIIRNIIKEDKNIHVDIDESLSSRIIISMFLNSNINPENIDITTKNPENTIIKELTGLTGLKIIKENEETIDNLSESIEKSYNTKLGLNAQINLQNNSKNTEYHLNNTNPYSNQNRTFDEIIEDYRKQAEYYNENSGKTVEKFIWRNIHKLQKHFKEYDIYSQEFRKNAYKHIILKNKLKSNVEKYLSNKITLNPLLDVNLQKISMEKEELYTTILLRYSPELLNTKLPDENISEKTLIKAVKNNEEHLLKKQDYPIIESPKHEEKVIKTTNQHEYDALIRKIFFSNTFKHTFLKYYSNHTYNQIIKKYTQYNFFDTNELNPAIAVIKIIDDVEYSQKSSINTEFGWLKNFIIKETPEHEKSITNYLLNKYNTARIDMKNEGSQSNQIKIMDLSDKSAKMTMPTWFTNDKGVGICLSSDKSEISFKIKCINEGKLKLDLRTLDIRDRNNKRFPVYIDYLSFTIDGQEILKDNKLIWHDKPITYNKKVHDNEILQINIKWRPFSNISYYEH